MCKIHTTNAIQVGVTFIPPMQMYEKVMQSQAETMWRNSRWYKKASSRFLLCFWKSSPRFWWQNAQIGEHHSIIRGLRAWSSFSAETHHARRIPQSCLVQSTTNSLLHVWERPPNHSSWIRQVFEDKSWACRPTTRHRGWQQALRSEYVDVELWTRDAKDSNCARKWEN